MNYLKIDKEDVCNGEGLRVVLWLSGCSHKCKGCQNPQTWDANSGIPFDESAKEELFRELDKDYISGLTLSGGDPLFEDNLDGVLDLVTEVNKRYNQNVFQNAEMLLDRGISNALYSQKEYTEGNLNDCHRIRLSSTHKSIWLYTGFKWDNIFDNTLENLVNDGVPGLSLADECEKTIQITNKRKQIINQCDVIIDGQYIESQRDISLPYRGSSNQRLIDVKQSLQKGEIVLWQT